MLKIDFSLCLCFGSKSPKGHWKSLSAVCLEEMHFDYETGDQCPSRHFIPAILPDKSPHNNYLEEMPVTCSSFCKHVDGCQFYKGQHVYRWLHETCRVSQFHCLPLRLDTV